MMDKKNEPKISVILTAHNYAKFLGQAIDSVLNQTFKDFELIIVNDGSTDHTSEVLLRYSNDPRIRVINLGGAGLASACNVAISKAKGEYIIRLDADDFYDENILLIESNILDSRPEIHLVYSDYYRVDYVGNIIDHYRLMKSNDELKLLDRAPLGAGAMYRRSCYEEIGGYNEELRYQEDYDFWLRFINRYKVYNVRLPLMYYRQHEGSMSTNTDHRKMARGHVKHEFVKKHSERNVKITGLFGASIFLKKDFKFKFPLKKIHDQPLIYYPIKALRGCGYIEEVYISTDDLEVEKTAEKIGAKSMGLHSKELSKPSSGRAEIIQYFLKRLDEHGKAIPDIVVSVSPNYPFINAHNVREAIDTMLIHDYDSVISVIEHYDFYWRPGQYGLQPFGYNREMMKEDHESVYLEKGGIKVIKTKNFLGNNWLGNSVGFIELTEKEAISVKNDEFSISMASQMMEEDFSEDIPEDKFLYKNK